MEISNKFLKKIAPVALAFVETECAEENPQDNDQYISGAQF